MSNILFPDQITVTLAGGKAAALARLATGPFDVPAFFAISPDAVSDAAGALSLTPEALAALPPALRSLGPGPFAVRSSGRAEDGSDHSHAGQYLSVLNVAPGDVPQAVCDVWASGFGDRLATYQALTSGADAEAPAIIVQRMVPASAAGVAFSADPVRGVRGRCVISGVADLGEALVSGEVDGEDWVIGSGGQVLSGPATPGVLTVPQAQAVAELARRAETHFGSPQDIEWAYEGDRLVILQSRPITTPLVAAPMPDNAVTVFDNSNIVESYPGLVSPLTYSFARYVYGRVYRAFVALLGVRGGAIADNAAVFDNMLARLDGRVYYNLGNWYRALALLPGFSLNRTHMETMMGVDEPLPDALRDRIGPPPAHGLGKAVEWLRLGRVAVGLGWAALRLGPTKRRFYQRLETALSTGMPPDRANLTQLAATYRAIESSLLDRWDAPLVNDFLCMMAFGGSRKLLEAWAGPEGLAAHNDVMIGQGDIVSAEPTQRIARMGAMVAEAGIAENLTRDGRAALEGHPAIAAELEAYLDRFGDRCTQELKLESIPLTEDPAQLLAAISASAMRARPDQTARPEIDWTILIPNRPLRRAIAKWLTSYARARVRDRENLRFERTRIFGHARRVFLAIGRELTALGRLDTPRDVFLLTVDEVLGAIEGAALSHDLRAIVAQRQQEATRHAALPDPPERIVLRGVTPEAFQAAAMHHSQPQTGDTRTGTGCSAGCTTARARVIRDPRQEHLAAGEILVALNTDPGWIAVFSNASAIVVERGSLLSHSAIVARELGIPCVVGIKGATDWVQDGEILEVNGETGEVRKLHEPG